MAILLKNSGDPVIKTFSTNYVQTSIEENLLTSDERDKY